MASQFEREARSQPSCWRRAAHISAEYRGRLPADGSRVAFVGCGTSYYMAQAFASFRERQKLGESDAFCASEMPGDRKYDTVFAICRSGTTTEVLDALRRLPAGTRRIAITAVQEGPIYDCVDGVIALPWADEKAVVQSRFATTALMLLLSELGWNVEASASLAEHVLADPPPVFSGVRQFVFVGRGLATGIALEAALKVREALGTWSEAYATRELRHGPIAALGPGSIVWFLDGEEQGIDESILTTGARVFRGSGDPLVELVRVHQAVIGLAAQCGKDPDAPHFLARSVIL